MSTTSSPTRPVRSPTLVNNEEEAELQAFLAAAQHEAQEKWGRLRAAKMSEVAAQVAGVGAVVENAVIENMEVVSEKEERVVVLKVEPPHKKFVTRMVAIGPHPGREVIPVILIPKKRKVE
ncbi:hypothetical protein GGU11DRAFT_879388, partial [Lentinula aff. detonsa]